MVPVRQPVSINMSLSLSDRLSDSFMVCPLSTNLGLEEVHLMRSVSQSVAQTVSQADSMQCIHFMCVLLFIKLVTQFVRQSVRVMLCPPDKIPGPESVHIVFDPLTDTLIDCSILFLTVRSICSSIDCRWGWI